MPSKEVRPRHISYLFFLPSGAETGGVAGYNPPGYNFGFIYENLLVRLGPHELGHGIGSLRHPFDDETDVIGNTANLMDYSLDGEQLYHFQWDLMQNPKRRIFRWRFDEEEGEGVLAINIPNGESAMHVCFIISPYVSNIAYNLIGKQDLNSLENKVSGNGNDILGWEQSKIDIETLNTIYKSSVAGDITENEFQKIKDFFYNYRTVAVRNDMLKGNPNEYAYYLMMEGPKGTYSCKRYVIDKEFSQSWSGKGWETVCVQQFLEKFRRAYAYNTMCGFGQPWVSGHTINNVRLNDNNIYKMVTANVLAKCNFSIKKEEYVTITQTSEARYFLLDNSKNSIGENLGKCVSFTTTDKYTEFENYMFPSKDTYQKQAKNFIGKLSGLKDRKTVLSFLAVLPEEDYYLITMEERLRCLSLISNGSLTEDRCNCVNEERIAVNLVSKTPDTEDDCQRLISYLGKNGLMRRFVGGINDHFFGGSDNYTEFIASVAKKYSFIKTTEVSKLKINDLDGRVYVWDETRYSDKVIKTSYDDNGDIIFIESHAEDSYPPDIIHKGVNPFDLVAVRFATAPYILNTVIKPNDELVMPAFVFEWICINNSHKSMEFTANLFVSLASDFFAITGITRLQKIYSVCNVTLNTLNVMIQSKEAKSIAAKMFKCDNPDKCQWLTILQNIIVGWDYINPIIAYKWNDKIEEFDKFVWFWDTQNYVISNPEEKEIYQYIELLVEQYKTEKNRL